MKLLALILIFHIVWVTAGSSKKKTTDEATPTSIDLTNLTEDDSPKSTESPKVLPPAIIAIEIVDPTDNSTEARSNTKRTIESNLGYGYHGGIYKTQKKYMVYPYSQQDIPAPKRGGDRSITVQKAITYNLGTRIEPDIKYNPQAQNYYPSTLYSTLNQQGHIGSLSTQFPGNYHGQTVPVIILRVYSNQLTNPHAGIYPNLPQTHPQASYLNTVNLQELVMRYLKQHKQKLFVPAQQGYNQGYQEVDYSGYQGQQGYSNQGYQYQTGGQGYTQYQPVYQTQYQTPIASSDASTLPTHENYPDDAHTRVIYHSPRGHIQGGVSFASVNYPVQNTVAATTKIPVSQFVYKDSGIKQTPAQYSYDTGSKQTQYTYDNGVMPKHNLYNYDTGSKQVQAQYVYDSGVQMTPTQYTYNTASPVVNYNYETTKMSNLPQYVYSDNPKYKQNTIYMDQNGQNYIYVLPSQVQNVAHTPNQVQAVQNQVQNDYTNQNQVYYQPGYQYDSSKEYVQDNQQTESPFNYHAHEAKRNKERNKKSSGSPVMFDSNSSTEKKSS